VDLLISVWPVGPTTLPGSILVVVDLLISPGRPPVTRSSSGFSILLSWISSSADESERCSGGPDGVSSLLSWISSSAPARRPPQPCSLFNPCCRGSPYQPSARHQRRQRLLFSILLSWISLISVVAERRGRRGARCFNPCCRDLLISVIGESGAAVRGRGLPVSILVVWIPSSAQVQGFGGHRGACFNPCCRWISLISRPMHANSMPTGGFNPCCRGSPSSA